MKTVRTRRGNAMVMVVGLSFFTAVLIVGVSKLTMTMGGSKEAQNAAEAGALHMAAKTVNAIKVEPQGFDELQFSDLLDSQGKIGLTNINRVWSKALLANINVSAMNSLGEGSDLASQHAHQLYDSAQRISDRLADKLTDPSERYQFFNEMAGRNLVSMAGGRSGAEAVKGAKFWRTSLLDRKLESNVIVSKDQIPVGFDYSKLQTKNVSGSDRLRGYAPVSVLDKEFCFVPFKDGERTQLVSAENFEKNTLKAKPLPEWKKPVPNAFSTQAKAKGSALVGTAYVLVNPQRNFKLSMPNGFVRIRLEKNEAMCFVGKGMPETLSYDYDTEFKIVGPKSELSVNLETGAVGTTNVLGMFNLGTEYGHSCTLKEAIFARRHEDIVSLLLQRVREIKPDCSRDELLQVLDSQKARAGDYIICAESSAADAKLMVAPFNIVTSRNRAINVYALADGRMHTIAEEDLRLLDSIEAMPYAVALTAGIWLPNGPFELNEGEIKWQPGSGFDGCLGTLEVKRKTFVIDQGLVLTGLI